ncbi:MAG: hypothetical protein WAM05_14920, partial [Candidatus Binataceae bacterium]
LPNECSGFCQVCSWLNCSALCPIPLRATMVPWKHPAHHFALLCRPHSTPMLPRPGPVINPTTKTPKHKEPIHFRAPRAEMNLLRVLVSSSSLVPSCLVLFREMKRVQKSMTEKAAETNPFGGKRQHFEGVYFLSH